MNEIKYKKNIFIGYPNILLKDKFNNIKKGW